MRRRAAETDQAQINRFCRAASAAYYEIVQASVRRECRPAMLPALLCPLSEAPSTSEFSEQELLDAESFLLRLGVIEER